METYTRQETAQKTGIPDRTIRFWIHEGIMDHPEIKANTVRLTNMLPLRLGQLIY